MWLLGLLIKAGLWGGIFSVSPRQGLSSLSLHIPGTCLQHWLPLPSFPEDLFPLASQGVCLLAGSRSTLTHIPGYPATSHTTPGKIAQGCDPESQESGVRGTIFRVCLPESWSEVWIDHVARLQVCNLPHPFL